VERLYELGVLEIQPAPEWALPSFKIPKKDRTICFLSNFWDVNKRLVRKPFPIPKISTVLQELEELSFATALDLNMCYYTIRLDPDAFKIYTIIFPWGNIPTSNYQWVLQVPHVSIPTRNIDAVTQHLLTRRNFLFLNFLGGF
jgi:hypothetical protein